MDLAKEINVARKEAAGRIAGTTSGSQTCYTEWFVNPAL